MALRPLEKTVQDVLFLIHHHRYSFKASVKAYSSNILSEDTLGKEVLRALHRKDGEEVDRINKAVQDRKRSNKRIFR